MSVGSINRLQLAMLFVTFTGLSAHVALIPVLLNAAGRDAWIVVLVVSVPFIGWGFLLRFYSLRMRRQAWDAWLSSHWRPWIVQPLVVILLLLLLNSSALTLRDTVQWAHTLFLLSTPTLIIVFLFSLVCLYAALMGLGTIAIVNGILLPFIILFGCVVAVGNAPLKDYGNLFPVLTHGFSQVEKGIPFVAETFAELAIWMLIQHEVARPVHWSFVPLVLGSIVVITLGPLTGAIAEFGPVEAAHMKYPAYEEWRLLRFGMSLDHVDVLSIYQWLSGAFIRIALIWCVMKDTAQRAWKVQPKASLSVIGVTSVGINLIPLTLRQYQDYLRVYYPTILIVILILTVIWGITVWRVARSARKMVSE